MGRRKRDSIGNLGFSVSPGMQSSLLLFVEEGGEVQNAVENLMNTFSRFPYPRLRIAVDILGGKGGENTFSLPFSQPSGAVTITLSNVS